MSDYIAVDWGSSNFRAMRVNRGEVVKSVASPKGVARTPREALGVILREELARLGDDYDASTPVILCGMIGSNIGIVDAGYQSLPLSFRALTARGVVLEGVLPNPLTVRPGICSPSEHEICRGEEMQLAGALTLCDARVFAAVGTHSKWLRVDRHQQQVISLRTLMTGELYHLVLNHSVVGRGLPEQRFDDDRFQDGVETAIAIAQGNAGLVSELFRCRGRYILGEFDAACASAWLSGLLIGHEILCGHPREETVCFIGAASLLPRYQQACELLNLPCLTLEAETALIAGLNKVFSDAV
ncbi:2-dehydro-3-deoxygalactonokinase [Franconibacter helveticus 513]|uniref:2-dehydro-3-deoxygalactonokinase n=1 Tax=Franconibacter helveticus TaxID=357240 RepID=UPI0003FAA400|nr:2-dehydro-3-deoxygalactonokinase [Franconibacter helveticus]